MDMSTTSLSSIPTSILTRRSLPAAKQVQIFFPQRIRSLRFNPIVSCSSSDSSNTNVNDGGNSVPDSIPPPIVTPPGAVEVRFRRRSRRQSRQRSDDGASLSSAQYGREGSAVLAQQVCICFNLHNDRGLDTVQVRGSISEPLPVGFSSPGPFFCLQGIFMI